METWSYPGLSTIHIALFTNVKNASIVRSRLVSAPTIAGEAGEFERDAINFAFINAALVTSKLHLQTAIYNAILAEANESLRTKYVHSEILFMLNPNNNITESIKRFGVSDSSTSLILVRIEKDLSPAANIEFAMLAVVSGTLVDLRQLKDVTDWVAVRKCYKLNTDPAIVALSRPDRLRAVIDEIVVSTVAIKSVAG